MTTADSDTDSSLFGGDASFGSGSDASERPGVLDASRLAAQQEDDGPALVAQQVSFPLGLGVGWTWPSSVPVISGLYYLPGVLDLDVQGAVLDAVIASNLVDKARDQAMVFPQRDGSLPGWAETLLGHLRQGLRGLPDDVYALLFPGPSSPPRQRQLIVNAYAPGQGIRDHVDLLDRFDDGILVCSLLAPIAMDLRARGSERATALYLRPGSVLVLSGEARYAWTHGIAARASDLVHPVAGGGEGDSAGGRGHATRRARQARFSVTLRWMRAGGEVLR